MRKRLDHIRILLVCGRILDAVFCALVAVPINKLIKEYVCAFLKQPRSKGFVFEHAQPQWHVSKTDFDLMSWLGVVGVNLF